jgi:hypothetical protein
MNTRLEIIKKLKEKIDHKLFNIDIDAVNEQIKNIIETRATEIINFLNRIPFNIYYEPELLIAKNKKFNIAAVMLKYRGSAVKIVHKRTSTPFPGYSMTCQELAHNGPYLLFLKQIPPEETQKITMLILKHNRRKISIDVYTQYCRLFYCSVMKDEDNSQFYFHESYPAVSYESYPIICLEFYPTICLYLEIDNHKELIERMIDTLFEFKL